MRRLAVLAAVVPLLLSGCGLLDGDETHYPPTPDEIQAMCAGRGGVRSVSTDRNGAAAVVICKDGTIGTF